MNDQLDQDTLQHALWQGLASRRPLFVVRHEDGRVVRANEVACQALGYAGDALLGLTLEEIHDEFDLDLIQRRRDLTQGSVADGELCLRRADGGELWLFLESLPHPDVEGFACQLLLGRDCLQQVQTRIEHSGQMEALRRGQAIAEYDLNGHLISANDIFLALMNGSMAELEGMAHQDLCDPVFSFSEAYKVWWEHIRLGEVDEGTRRYVDLSGREIWLREVFNPIFGTDGRPFKVLHAALDVTRGRTAELQLIESMNYAGRIQQAMHEPSREALARHLRDRYGLVWQPRDPVGGDCFFAREADGQFWFGLFDCTGHGAPGAMLATIVLSVVDRIVSQENGDLDPAAVLQRLNRRMKVVLDQEFPQRDGGAGSDDGLDGIVICLHPRAGRARVASSGLPLLLLEPGDEPQILKWESGGMGYRSVPMDRVWKSQTVELKPESRLFVATDGVFDQIGGPREIGYGSLRFASSLARHQHLAIPAQCDAALKDYLDYQGTQHRRDDMSFAGLQLPTA
ncbi:MAG: PAS domain S-box protein [Betaproteobacteria bacterium]|nr:PAS domain S-box protein [Betaproteobacteria bacterium]